MHLFWNILIAVCLISGSTASANELPVHKGRCGKVGEIIKNIQSCKIGEVVIINIHLMTQYCDYRYSIHRAINNKYYVSCVLRTKS